MKVPLLLASAFLVLMLALGLVLTSCGTPTVPRHPLPAAEPGGPPPGPSMVPILRLPF